MKQHFHRAIAIFAAAPLAIGTPGWAQEVESEAPQRAAKPLAAPSPVPTPAKAPTPAETSVPVIQPLPGTEEEVAPFVDLTPVRAWPVADAKALLRVIEGIGAEGLFPRDYNPAELKAAIAAGKGDALNEVASRGFTWLVEDLRDGRTPMDNRKQWFVVDPDPDASPTAAVMDKALASHDIAGTLAALDPTHPDFATLRQMLAETPQSDKATRTKIRINMDRWRWLPRDLGGTYLLTNVPEYQLRLTVNNRIIRSYRTVVGKPGNTATPQLAEVVEGVIFNPTWTVPQSIVVGEGLGARALGNPAWARAKGYKAWKDKATGFVTVVQQPGPGNALGLVKLDMPNPHAIFLHDTPTKEAFTLDKRALSHGCIRTERALEMAMTMAILGGGATPEEAVAISNSREYTRVPLKKTFPVYITYFTMAEDIDGVMRSFDDLYERDVPVAESFAAPRQLKTGQRETDEAVVPIEDPGL
ncbi:MAG: L,D-transpeptidase family protein [Novosphingobium sp.]